MACWQIIFITAIITTLNGNVDAGKYTTDFTRNIITNIKIIYLQKLCHCT